MIIRDEFSISHLIYTLIRMTNNVFTFNTTTIFSLKNLLTWTLVFNYGKKQKKNAVLKFSVACASFLSLSLSRCLSLSLSLSLSLRLCLSLSVFQKLLACSNCLSSLSNLLVCLLSLFFFSFFFRNLSLYLTSCLSSLSLCLSETSLCVLVVFPHSLSLSLFLSFSHREGMVEIGYMGSWHMDSRSLSLPLCLWSWYKRLPYWRLL